MSEFDKELSEVEHHLERKERLVAIGRHIKHLDILCESMKPRLKMFRSDNVCRLLTMFFLGVSVEGLFPHEVHPHFMPTWASVALMTLFFALVFFFEDKNSLKKGECIAIFASAFEIVELRTLYQEFLRRHSLNPSYVRDQARRAIQALEKEKETLQIEEEIFRQSKESPRV